MESQTRHFEVAKYTIPRFTIELSHPKVLYFQAEALKISVCGKYSHNKPVAGLAFVKISSSMDNFDEVHKLSEVSEDKVTLHSPTKPQTFQMVFGCAEFKFNQTELNLEILKHQQFPWQTYLHLTATVTEFGTNKMDVTTGRIELTLQVPCLQPQPTSHCFFPLHLPGFPSAVYRQSNVHTRRAL